MQQGLLTRKRVLFRENMPNTDPHRRIVLLIWRSYSPPSNQLAVRIDLYL